MFTHTSIPAKYSENIKRTKYWSGNHFVPLVNTKQSRTTVQPLQYLSDSAPENSADKPYILDSDDDFPSLQETEAIRKPTVGKGSLSSPPCALNAGEPRLSTVSKDANSSHTLRLDDDFPSLPETEAIRKPTVGKGSLSSPPGALNAGEPRLSTVSKDANSSHTLRLDEDFPSLPDTEATRKPTVVWSSHVEDNDDDAIRLATIQEESYSADETDSILHVDSSMRTEEVTDVSSFDGADTEMPIFIPGPRT
ncbi:hypothetical protein DPMN_072250 [Dreissena polymorpha]|uniref:Uncharacterized protein n=1 Tax=Dreissena polymorpha TaxID=45954 RepID=A0A9D4BXH6_DREPO|nr:hypothetical protein DPMN_072250 [Dreissena polymorpha]